MTAKRDQHILMNEELIAQIITLAELHKNDVVLEIGAGPGNLTRRIAETAGRVIALEIDKKFEPALKELPNTVEVVWGNAVDYFQMGGKFHQRREFNKIVSNLPYALCEPLLHNLTFIQYDKAVLLVPMGFAEKAKTNPVFGSFFSVQEKILVPKANFNPPPRTESVVIDLVKLPDPVATKNRELFLRQYLYKHEGQKSYNALVEGLVVFAELTGGMALTKNEARSIVDAAGIAPDLLERTPHNPEIYEAVKNRF